MKDTNISKKAEDAVKELLDGFQGFLQNKTVVGDPITVGDTILIPFSDISLGLGAGEYAGKKEGVGAAMGAKITPTAILLIQGNSTRLINIKDEDTVVRVLDLVPTVVDRVKLSFAKNKNDVDEAVGKMKEKKNA